MRPELRIHGVGSPSRARQLGVVSDELVYVDFRPSDAPALEVLARKASDDDGVRAFSWGSLNAGSRRTALWILLLPLTLINVAGWAVAGTFCSTQRAIIHLLAVVTSAVYVLWFGYLTLDLLALQWRRTLTSPTGVLVETVLPCVLVTLFGVLVVAFVEHAYLNRGTTAGADWKGEIAEADFFVRSIRRNRVLWAHLAVVVASVVFVGWAFFDGQGRPATVLNTAIVVAGSLQGMLCGSLLVLLGPTWVRAQFSKNPTSPLGLDSATFAAATVGAALSHAGYSGLGLLLVDRLHGTSAARPFMIGYALSTPANYLRAVIFAVVITVVSAFFKRVRNRGDDLVFAREGLFVAKSVALGCSIAGVWFGWTRVQDARAMSGSLSMFPRALLGSFAVTASAERSVGLNRLGAVALMSIPILLYRIIRSQSDGGKPGTVSTVWDVLTFWPRRFHPFCVPTSGHVAVPALARYLTKYDESGVVITAHSQGSVLAVAALHALGSNKSSSSLVAKTALVTYGSPIGGLYQRAFPSQFPALVKGLAGIGSWDNVARLSDPIGTSICLCSPTRCPGSTCEASVGARIHNHVIADDPPTHGPTRGDPALPREWPLSRFDRPTGHSGYLGDTSLRDLVQQRRESS